MKKLIVIVLSILFISMNASSANAKDSSSVPVAKNIVYAEAAIAPALGYIYFASLNYERIIFSLLSIRAGYGFSGAHLGSIGGTSEDYSGNGPSIMLNFHNPGKNKINLCAGIGYINFHNTQYGTRNGWTLFPAIALTYRFQPIKGGMYISTGMTVAFGGGGNSLGAGYIF